MIKKSETWIEVDEKLRELRALVDENWRNHEWQLAVLGESAIRAVERSMAAAEEMRQQVNYYLGFNE